VSERKVVCGVHGTTPATFACRHVASGVACGFHVDPDDGEWPDAWCDACDERLAAGGGEWTHEAEELADIKVLCTHCYELARDRNRDVPAHARGGAAALTEVEERRLIRHATQVGQDRQAAARARWRIGDRGEWYFDVDARTLALSDPGEAPVLADVRLVGSYSTRSSTFQWSWALYDEQHPLIAGIADLRTFGEVRGLTRLTETWWKAEQVDAWEMTSLAGYLLGFEGVYRAPYEEDDLYWFMLLDRFRQVS
jgi:hypothetical protein